MTSSAGSYPLRPRLLLGATMVAAWGLWFAWLFVFVCKIVLTPPRLSNEAEIMYEASRIARGLALYTDPLKGVLDDGPLPIRHYVLYGPLAPWLLSLARESIRLPLARALSVVSWFVGLPAVAWFAFPAIRAANGHRRAVALTAALAYAGLFLLARDVVHFTLTPIPVLLATVALVRILRRRRAGETARVPDVASLALLALAWALKPLVMGILLGIGCAVLADREIPRRQKLRAAILGATVFGAAVALLVAGTYGEWLVHLRASTQNGMLPQRWVHFSYDYFPILGLPHLAVACLVMGRSVRPASRFAAIVLFTSTLWAIFAMGKRGANAGYFLEPTSALVVTLACSVPMQASEIRGRVGRWFGRLAYGAVWLAPLLSLALSVPSLRSFAHEDAGREWAAIGAIRQACSAAAPGKEIRASLPSSELPLSGRVTLAAWQQTVLVNRGAFPLETLIDDLDVPALGCLVLSRGLTGDPPPETNELGEFTFFDVLFDVKLREPVRARFEEFATIDGLHLFRRRDGRSPQ